MTTTAESMAPKARGWLIVNVCHFLAVGVTILAWPAMYRGSEWVPAIRYTHLAPWGWGYLTVGVASLIAVAAGQVTLGRVAMVLAFVVLMATGANVGWGVVQTWVYWHRGLTDNPASPFIPLACVALAVRDLMVLSGPMLRETP